MNESDKPGLVCAECVAMDSEWVHLRHCRMCGHIACCDQSPNRHARLHANEESHAVIDSAESGERWSYCYVDNIMLGAGPGG